MDNSVLENERLALWLAPFVSVLPLVPLFGIPASPLFLGRLMADPRHPMNWPVWGPWLSSMAVVFDGAILAYFVGFLVVLPIYLFFRGNRALSMVGAVAIFGLGGVLASQLVHLLQGFRQPELRAFATSWLSPVMGCVCGLAAGAFFAAFARRRLSPDTRILLFPLPLAAVVTCAVALIAAARVWRSQ
jgi:hypothetical protein